MPGPQGLEHIERGLELLRAQISRYPDDNDSKDELSSLLATAATAQKKTGDLERAARDYQEAIQIREELLRTRPHDTINRRNLIVDYGSYAGTLGIAQRINLGRPAEGRVFAAKALALAQESVDADSQDATARYDLGMVWGIDGMIDPVPGQAKDSLASLEKAIAFIGPIAKANPESATSAQQLANLLEYRGLRLESLGRRAEAIQSYRESLELIRPFLESANLVVRSQGISSDQALAQAYASSGEFTTALDFANRAVEQAEKGNAGSPPDDYDLGEMGSAYANLALVEEKAGNLDLARQSGEKAKAMFSSIRNRGTISTLTAEIADTQALLARVPVRDPL
jgi:tetratricopeptide (TPR) repeat protein